MSDSDSVRAQADGDTRTAFVNAQYESVSVRARGKGFVWIAYLLDLSLLTSTLPRSAVYTQHLVGSRDISNVSGAFA